MLKDVEESPLVLGGWDEKPDADEDSLKKQADKRKADLAAKKELARVRERSKSKDTFLKKKADWDKIRRSVGAGDTAATNMGLLTGSEASTLHHTNHHPAVLLRLWQAQGNVPGVRSEAGSTGHGRAAAPEAAPEAVPEEGLSGWDTVVSLLAT